MIKKLLAIFSALLMLFSTFTVMAAAEIDVVFNGNFDMGALGWTLPEEAMIINGEEAYEGGSSLKIKSITNRFAYQYVDLVPGGTYELSFVTRAFDNGGAVVKFEMFTGNQWVGDAGTNWEITSQWQECTYTLKVPAGMDRAQMLMRLIGGGTIYYDNIKLVGPVPSGGLAKKDADSDAANILKNEQPKHVKASDAYGKEFISNGGFENVDGGKADKVETSDEWAGKNIVLTQEKPHGGKNALEISTENGGMPWAKVYSDRIVGGFKYQLSFWYRGENKSNDHPFTVLIEGFTAGAVTEKNKRFTAQAFELPSATAWTEVTYNLNIPGDCDAITITPIINGTNGTLFIDDISLYMTEVPELFEYDTDQVFYYSDLEYGKAYAILKPVFDNEGFTADFTLFDGEKVLASGKDVKINEDREAGWLFSLDRLKEKAKAYVLRTEVKNVKGDVISSYVQNIYKYDRPQVLTKDGTFIVDGEPYYPAMMYHVDEPGKMTMAAEQGLNLLQTVYNGTEGISGWMKLLDDVHAQGLKAAVVCYWSMKHAGDPVNVERIAEFVEAIKDHPAVFCYMTMDEPLGHYPDDENLRKIMETAYKTIRDIDPVHPIYHCESSINHYKLALKYTDVVGIDPYPGSVHPFETHVADATLIAEEHSAPFGKGVIQILQTFTYGKSPSNEQLHSMMYQSIMAGADANGLYPWVMDNPELDGPSLDVSRWWPVFTSFREKEYDVVWKHYGKHYDTKWFYSNKNDDNWVDMWVDGKDVYAVALNRLAEEQTISVPATSQNGLVTISDYTVTAVNGEAPIEKNAAGFDIKMPASSALLFKITPATDVDFSKVNEFGDIATYTWAEEMIKDLYAKGIANSKGDYTYAPGAAITRGDFAMYLMRALGLEKAYEFESNFDDVSADAEYAAAVAVGKKIGVLKGTGGNNYNPEAPITRQDLMVICLRGIQLVQYVDGADLSSLDAFSDKDLIADYAGASIAAMVRDGIIKGNADGTVNPLGNTTRAEAAVIMSRIIDLVGQTA